MVHMLEQVAAAFEMPPATVPLVAKPAMAPVWLQRMALEENPVAFALADLAFSSEGGDTPNERGVRQGRWDAGGRAWFGWLHARAAGNAWVARAGADGPVIGYARAVRDPARRLECLTELYVHPAFQRGKVGQALLGAVLPPQVPGGWRRVIVAHPAPSALALYARWGTLPLATAWYVVAHAKSRAPVRGIERDGGSTQLIQQGDDASILDLPCRCAHAMCVCVGRWGQMALLAQHLGGNVHVLRRGTAAVGAGLCCGNEIGPILGATPADTLALVQRLFQERLAHGATQVGLWVPGMNSAVLRWLHALPDVRLAIQGQVTIMASDPALAACLDRALLTAPPYLW
jgi:GNAT superfamily N-acetyltransferase